MRTKGILLSAALAAGGIGFLTTPLLSQNAAQRTENAAQRTGDAIRNAADRVTGTTNPSNAMASDAEDMREMLKEVTQASLTKGGFDDMIERFVDADRTRLGKDNFTKQDHTVLDGRIAQFQKDWQAKYNQEFKIKDKEAVYSTAFATFIQSEIPKDARLAGERQTGTATPTPAPGMQPDVNTSQAQRDANKVAGGDTNREPGRNIATVQVAASHGLPALTLPLIHEFPDRWKIDVPDSYSSQQMHDNLLKHLTMLDEHKDQWPADVNEAYRLVSHHVLMAVINASDSDMNNNMNRTMPATPAAPVTPR